MQFNLEFGLYREEVTVPSNQINVKGFVGFIKSWRCDYLFRHYWQLTVVMRSLLSISIQDCSHRAFLQGVMLRICDQGNAYQILHLCRGEGWMLFASASESCFTSIVTSIIRAFPV